MLIAVLAAFFLVAAPRRLRWPRPVAPRIKSRRDRTKPADEVALLNGLAAELRAGASLRMALTAAADRVPTLDLARAIRLAGAGMSPVDLADELAHALPINGRLVGAAFRLAATSGARSAAMFEQLALRAAEAGELMRERRSLTAQARLSAGVVGGAPIAVAFLLLTTGRAQALLDAGPLGYAIVMVGLGLELVGLAAVAAVLRRAERAA